jgi:hypothetical protein
MFVGGHLAQDGTRLECDIKFQRIESVDIAHRIALEVELASRLDFYLAKKLPELLDMRYWSRQWKALPNDFKLVAGQIMDIRRITLTRLGQNKSDESYSEYVDYTVALLMQSLMFVRYARNPLIAIHAWSAACLAATLIDQFFAAKIARRATQDSLGHAMPINL